MEFDSGQFGECEFVSRQSNARISLLFFHSKYLLKNSVIWTFITTQLFDEFRLTCNFRIFEKLLFLLKKITWNCAPFIFSGFNFQCDLWKKYAILNGTCRHFIEQCIAAKKELTWKMFKRINLNFMLKSRKTFYSLCCRCIGRAKFCTIISSNIHFIGVQLAFFRSFWSASQILILIAVPLFGFHLPLELDSAAIFQNRIFSPS